jgi:hypothetical protein
VARARPNPFRYGELALDEAFTDREAETRELKADIRNGQNVVLFSPRRYGKSSLVWRVSHELIAAGEARVAGGGGVAAAAAAADCSAAAGAVAAPPRRRPRRSRNAWMRWSS